MNKKSQRVKKSVLQARLRFSDPEQHARIVAAAQSRGLSFDKFVREVADAAARRVLQASPERNLGDALLDAPSIAEHPRRERVA